ncbi:glycosyltransferase family 2 protein [Halalkalicoccus salilacus]|uniref:glycosyltransferase family 2 protein n=1 Tax=Halalkalicoccus salilacus TaxID=3117459 RepID=UPI00300F2B82
MYNDKTIAAVVPAYNEEPFIGDVIETLPEFIDRAYVIDDRSTDDTWGEIQRKAEAVNEGGETTLDRVVPIRHAKNKGVGGAIKTGYLHALEDEMEVTTVIAGDGQTEPDIVERIVAPVADGRAEYSKGNRLLGRERRDMPMFRQIGNFTLTLITKIASGYWKIMDPQNGSTAISYEALDRVGIEQMYEGYGYCNDLLVRLNANNVRVADVKRRAVYKDEESDIDYKTYIPRVSGLLLRGFLWRLRTKYLIRDFHPLALFYYVGAATAGAGLLSGLKSAVNRDSGTSRGSSLVLFVLGWLFMLLAMVFDLQENEDLELLLYDEYE